jgi:hypothetical protein
VLHFVEAEVAQIHIEGIQFDPKKRNQQLFIHSEFVFGSPRDTDVTREMRICGDESEQSLDFVCEVRGWVTAAFPADDGLEIAWKARKNAVVRHDFRRPQF